MIFRKTLAIDIGGTFIKYGVIGEDGSITHIIRFRRLNLKLLKNFTIIL